MVFERRDIITSQIKRLFETLQEDQQLDKELEDLYAKDPDGFTQNSLEVLKEKGFDLSQADLRLEDELSLEELELVSGGTELQLLGGLFCSRIYKS